ncbi:glycosyltransferase family 2 protein [Acidimangrovimonas sediminis]|uniref:glycosyltransferase family 2 protein n=1 Tax=Acidimangrovimonas sediminis TaxID=2056283 RepID=UPI000C7FCDF4|nr:glycosyltransferase family 2 protein [Acidimangrovimonas sediminis]
MSEISGPTVSILVPTFRRLEILKECLAGCETQTRQIDEIVIVHRPDADPETAAWLEEVGPQHPLWRCVPASEAGVVAALNTGIGATRGDIIAIFDDDAVPHPDWLEKVLTHFEDPAVGGVGGRDFVHGHRGLILEPRTTVAGVRDNWHSLIGGHHLVEGPPRPVEVLKGCNWALRRAALDSLKLDPRLLGKGAQVDNEAWFCLCLRAAGWRLILDPQAQIQHHPAQRSDIDRSTWSRQRCFEQACNSTAVRTALLTPAQRWRYIWRMVTVGTRYCPGLYYLAHGLVKRPGQILGVAIGGWSVFRAGLRLGRQFRDDPPGIAAPAPISQGEQK